MSFFALGLASVSLTLTPRLGAGAFARVHKCVERATGNEYAVKIIDRGKLRNSHGGERAIVREIGVLRQLADFRHVWSLFPHTSVA